MITGFSFEQNDNNESAKEVPQKNIKTITYHLVPCKRHGVFKPVLLYVHVGKGQEWPTCTIGRSTDVEACKSEKSTTTKLKSITRT